MDLLLGEAELPEEIVHMHELKCEGALDVVTDFEKFEDLLLPPLRLQELPSTLRANQEFRHQYTKYCALVGKGYPPKLVRKYFSHLHLWPLCLILMTKKHVLEDPMDHEAKRRRCSH